MGLRFLINWVLGFGLLGFLGIVFGLWFSVSGFWGFGLCYKVYWVPRGVAPLAGP